MQDENEIPTANAPNGGNGETKPSAQLPLAVDQYQEMWTRGALRAGWGLVLAGQLCAESGLSMGITLPKVLEAHPKAQEAMALFQDGLNCALGVWARSKSSLVL